MAWKRQLILARLYVVLSGIPGIAEAVHNRAVNSDKRPAILLLDADEVADRAYQGRGRPANSPNLVVMSPEIYVILKNVKPVNETVGADLNAFCAAIIKAVITDAEINVLVGSNGEIRYDGLVTDLGEDRSIEGKARVGMSFVYVIRPDEL
jgi:hypothetical protein